MRTGKHDGRIGYVQLGVHELRDLTSADAIAEVNRPRYREIWAERESTGARGRYAMEWLGGLENIGQAVDLFNLGWQDGASRAAVVLPSIPVNQLPQPVSIRRRVRFGEDGDELHIDRAIAGDWSHAWRGTTRANVTSPRVLSLGCNFGGRSDITHEQLFWCAAQMIVTADLLEQAGYQVELRALKCNDIEGGRKAFIDCTVKTAGQPLRADTIAATFGHAGSYRVFGHFALMAQPYKVPYGLGQPGAVASAAAELAAAGIIEPLDVVLEHAYDAETAARNIAAALTKATGGQP